MLTYRHDNASFLFCNFLERGNLKFLYHFPFICGPAPKFCTRHRNWHQCLPLHWVDCSLVRICTSELALQWANQASRDQIIRLISRKSETQSTLNKRYNGFFLPFFLISYILKDFGISKLGNFIFDVFHHKPKRFTDQGNIRPFSRYLRKQHLGVDPPHNLIISWLASEDLLFRLWEAR